MNADDIQQFLTRLGCVKIKSKSNGWVEASCPFSWLHKAGQDRNPSFGVHIAETLPKWTELTEETKDLQIKQSGYHCHSCYSKGSLYALVWNLAAVRPGLDVNALLTLLYRTENYPPPHEDNDPDKVPSSRTPSKRPQGRFGTPPVPSSSAPVEVAGIFVAVEFLGTGKWGTVPETPTLPETDLKKLPDLDNDCRAYLTGKGLDVQFRMQRNLLPETVVLWELRHQPQAHRLVIPIRDCKGRLVGISGRAMQEHITPKYLHSKGFKKELYLYGEHLLRESGNGTGYIVEGFFDAMALREKGYPAVAIMGGHLSRFQMEKFRKFFDRAVIVRDGDPAGILMAERCEKSLKDIGMPVSVVHPVAEGLDPDELSMDYLREKCGAPSLGLDATTSG